MDIKVNNIAQVTQVPDTVTTETGDGTFKFTLASAITDADLQAKVDLLMNDITAQGNLSWESRSFLNSWLRRLR